jgi:hydroxymethylpyrimidine/phosphomethylpyrimidine kinase
MQEPKRRYRRVLTVAGSDSGGGAGIQADLKTFAALGCYGMSVVTALTAQNTCGVTGIHAVPADFVQTQLDAVLTDIGADAVKLGMLFSADIVETVARCLEAYRPPHVVLDPVMVAQSGDRLLREDAIEAIRSRLLPLATVVTPNLPEAEVLSGTVIAGPEKAHGAARILADAGARAVLVKGGHAGGDLASDLLYLPREDRFERLDSPRVETTSNHGTGCTLSSAIAAYLAAGKGLTAAVRAAKAYLTEAIRTGAAYRLGRGHGPVHHLHRFWS